MNYNIYYSILLFLMSCLMFSLIYKHILLTLINMEFMIINTIYNMYMTFFNLKNKYFLYIFIFNN
uniref:NADH dehydrogenase subunit 4L n=1 Tax=Ichneutes sp. QL-2013 TaxID=1421596 RepID=A0A0A6ZKT9_9HYME|nr:NADH dehydrogenase subunit 4L [Ichneutes sp. QL-2013]